MGMRKAKLFLGAALVATAIAAAGAPAMAQGMAADKQVSVSIPSQRLSDALRQLGEASGLQFVYDAKITDGKTSAAISGPMTVRAALARLLAGSALNFSFSGDRTVLITSAAGDGVRAVGVVNVQGTSDPMLYAGMASPVNGINGSRDVEATEGTGSYTTGAVSIASKTPLSIRETPQSVSVMTAQQIQDEALLSLQDVLTELPGVSTSPGPNGSEFTIYSRGFQITNYSFDGGAPISYGFNNRPVLDLSEFDSAQVIRGADGLFGGYGDPGGAVNLQRRKPLDHNQVTYSQDIGSWSDFREEADVTGPMTPDGKLRGRFVASNQDQNYFYHVANSAKYSLYGILEYDITPNTLLTVGGNYVHEHSVPNEDGLPRNINGSPIDFPISTCLCVSFAYDHATRREAFVTLTQKFNDNLSTKLNASYNYQEVNARYYGVTTAVYTGFPAVGDLGGYASSNPTRQSAIDYTINGKFKLLGINNGIVAGLNYQYIDADGSNDTNLPDITVPNIFAFNSNAYTLPSYPDTPFQIALKNDELVYGAYANYRIEPLKGLHFIVGLRYSWYRNTSTNYSNYGFGGFTQINPALKEHSFSRPNLAATYDFLKNFTAYISRESIYQPQLDTLGSAGITTPPPVSGVNEEAGLKWQAPNKKLNASIAFYKITQNNFLTPNYSNPGSYQAALNDLKSSEFDIEAAGELLPNWQISASFSNNTNKQVTSYSDAPSTSFTPRNKLKAWTVYRMPSGFLRKVIVGGGVDFQTRTYNEGSVCNAPVITPTTLCNFNPAFIPYQFSTNGYTTLAVKLGYKINDHIEVALDGKNITNVKAYAANPGEGVSAYNFYITPANFVLSLHAKW